MGDQSVPDTPETLARLWEEHIRTNSIPGARQTQSRQ